MKTIGQVIKTARQDNRFSYQSLAEETKIKKEFIKAIEEEKWDKLPEYPVLHGFIRNLAETLEISTNHALALFRRDYPPEKKTTVNPKPDIKSKFVWSPRLTFIAGVSLVILVISSYLVYQYFNFTRPPDLTVTQPSENATVEEDPLIVEGSTDVDATIVINNQPVIVDEEGNFRAQIDISKETKEILILAKSRSGRETKVTRHIIPDLE